MKKKIIISISIISIVCLAILFVRPFVNEYLYIIHTYKFKQYADSTYTNPIDSIIFNFKDDVYDTDSLINNIPNFKDGFYALELNSTSCDIFSRVRYRDSEYSTGEYKNKKKVGKWKYYNFIGDPYPLYEKNYNDKGELNGSIIFYEHENH